MWIGGASFMNTLHAGNATTEGGVRKNIVKGRSFTALHGRNVMFHKMLCLHLQYTAVSVILTRFDTVLAWVGTGLGPAATHPDQKEEEFV